MSKFDIYLFYQRMTVMDAHYKAQEKIGAAQLELGRELAALLKESGVFEEVGEPFFNISWGGVSTYVYASCADGRHRVKARISDHGVENVHRIFEEVHVVRGDIATAARQCIEKMQRLLAAEAQRDAARARHAEMMENFDARVRPLLPEGTVFGLHGRIYCTPEEFVAHPHPKRAKAFNLMRTEDDGYEYCLIGVADFNTKLKNYPSGAYALWLAKKYEVSI